MMIGMTRLYSLTAILLLSASCSLRIPGEPETVTLRLEAAMEETGSRAGVQEDGTVLWQTGDKIAVLLDNDSVAALTLESGAGSNIATFSGEIPAARSFAGKAGYPWWDGAWSGLEGELVLTLPASVPWPGNDYIPAVMKASSASDALSFRHEGAILEFTVKDMPDCVSSFRFSTSGGAVMGRNDFSYTFTPSAGHRVFRVPVVAGTLPAYTLSLLDVSGGEVVSKRKSKSTSVQRCDYRCLTPLSVKASGKIRLLYYNVLNGMERDAGNGYEHFAAWVRSLAPDVLMLAEAGDLDDVAPLWGHAYAAKISLDNYPLVVTSSHSLPCLQRISNPGTVCHGALHVRMDDRYDIVALHLRPTLDDNQSGKLDPEEYAKYGALRKTELSYILSRTLDNSAYASVKNWIFCGDFNAYSPQEKTAVSPYNGLPAYTYSEPTASVCYEVYPLIADKLKDVIWYKHAGAFKPSMYHSRSRLDYFFVSDGLYSRVAAADVVLGGFPGNYNSSDVNPSDHMPLLMDLTTYSFKVLDGTCTLSDWDEEALFDEE